MAAAGLSELEQEFYSDIINANQDENKGAGEGDSNKDAENKATEEAAAKQVADAKIAEEQEAANQASAASEAKKQEDEQKELADKAAVNTKSNKKYIPLDDEKAIYETLDKKYRYDRMKPEEKALAFIKQQNPELDDNELEFVAASDYGIGVEKLSQEESDRLTDEQVLALRKQDIARKKLFTQADNYFKEEAGKVTLDGVDPIEDNEEFKTYRTRQSEQAQIQANQEKELQNTIKQVEAAVNTISELTVPIEIDIDDRKFAVDVKFKMDAEKQKQVIDYSKRYVPTDSELAQFTDTTGKFDWKGYHEELANRLFYKDIVKAGLRQGLSEDREAFLEKELKNSTLRNNEVSQVADNKVDFVDVYWAKYAGT